MNMNAAAITDLKTEKITMHAENNRFCTWPKLLLGCSCTLDLQKIPQLWFFVSATCCLHKRIFDKISQNIAKEPQLWFFVSEIAL